MFIKTINYKDFDGNERSEDFYFNLTQSEILKLETSLNGGLTSYMSLMVQKQSQPDIMNILRRLLTHLTESNLLTAVHLQRLLKHWQSSRLLQHMTSSLWKLVWTKQKLPSFCLISCLTM